MIKTAIRDYRGKNYGYITEDSNGNKYVTDWKVLDSAVTAQVRMLQKTGRETLLQGVTWLLR